MVSRLLPRAVAAGDAAQVYALAMAAGEDMQAERMAALLCDTLTDTQKADIAARACAGMPVAVLAQLGALAFSFPLWRYPSRRTQSMGSLIEAAGYQRHTRPSDLRDAALPDPARDALGVGFIRTYAGEYMEYRRAYLLYACADGAILIRNSSYFFGRDRLAHPVYVATGAQTPDTLAALTAQVIDDGDLFAPLSDAHAQLAPRLLTGLMRHENALHDWLWGEGLALTLDSLHDLHQARRGMPYLGIIRRGWPAWAPRHVVALDEGVIADIAQGLYAPHEGERTAMLSGPAGDFPLG